MHAWFYLYLSSHAKNPITFLAILVMCIGDAGGTGGIGDINGIRKKLRYIKSLGCDGIWFSPLYPSPNADYGYDISDYKNIHPDFGTLRQFRRVLKLRDAENVQVHADETPLRVTFTEDGREKNYRIPEKG
mgnify:CR=1 FL=1